MRPYSIAAAATGMVVFALCAHQGWPWIAVGAGGLVMAGAAIGLSSFGPAGFGALLGLTRFSTRAAIFSLVGLAIGAGAGLWHRDSLGLPLQPTAAIQPFVIVACLIGATEEILYRGWMIGQARAWGWPAAVLIGAVAHAAYKTALFAWPAVPAPVDLSMIFLATVGGGTVLGLLRRFSGSLIPAILAHVAFDFVVYRSLAEAPWWVWG